MKKDIHQEITDKVVQALEAGAPPWLKPWKSVAGFGFEPYNAFSGRPYNGINFITLLCSGWADMGWLTFKKIKELGGKVRKGEPGTAVIFWKPLEKKDKKTGEKKRIMLMKFYFVWNVEQCEGLDMARLKRPVPPVPGKGCMNKLAARVGAVVTYGGNEAAYSPKVHRIRMPSLKQFKSEADHDATLGHELVHWTQKDCDRKMGSYAMEELVAELGSAFLCAQLGVPLAGLQHENYIAGWVKAMKEDKKAIFTAATKAKQAVKFLMEGEKEEEDVAA